MSIVIILVCLGLAALAIMGFRQKNPLLSRAVAGVAIVLFASTFFVMQWAGNIKGEELTIQTEQLADLSMEGLPAGTYILYKGDETRYISHHGGLYVNKGTKTPINIINDAKPGEAYLYHNQCKRTDPVARMLLGENCGPVTMDAHLPKTNS